MVSKFSFSFSFFFLDLFLATANSHGKTTEDQNTIGYTKQIVI
jgi:hypothetical protein